MNGMINDKPKETRRLQQSAVEITRLSPEYSRRSKTETQRFRALLESNSEIRKAIKRGSLRASFFVDLGDLMGCRAVPCRNNPRRTKRSFVRWVYFAPLIFKKIMEIS